MIMRAQYIGLFDPSSFSHRVISFRWLLRGRIIVMAVVLVLIYFNLNKLRLLSNIGVESKKNSYNSFLNAQIMIVLVAITAFIWEGSLLWWEPTDFTISFAHFGFFWYQVYILNFAWSISSKPRKRINLLDLLE